MEILLTIKDVANRLQVDDETVRRWLRDGRLKGCKLSEQMWRIEEVDLQEFIRTRQVG
jgi:excisionase family DNA binding protein